jgi:hypothetical protein
MNSPASKRITSGSWQVKGADAARMSLRLKHLVLILLVFVLAGCGTVSHRRYMGCPFVRPPGTYWREVHEDPARWDPVTKEELMFNPGLDPANLQPGDKIFIPRAYDLRLAKILSGDVWVKEVEKEFRIDLNGDGKAELLKTHLLREGRGGIRRAEGWQGIPFLCVLVEQPDGNWVRRHTFAWKRDGFSIRDVKFYRLEGDYHLLHVKMFGDRHSLLLVEGSNGRVSRLRFMGGLMDDNLDFAMHGSAGHFLHFKMSEDKRTVFFRQYFSTPIPVLTEAEYRLERGKPGGHVFSLVREERLPLSKIGERW